MAEEKQKEEEAAAAAIPNPGKKKLFIIIGAVVGILIIAGVPAVYFILKGRGEVTEASSDAAQAGGFNMEGHADEEELQEGEEPLGALFPFDTFVVNLSGGGFIRLQIQAEFMTRDISASFYPKVVPIRDGVIEMLSARNRDSVLSAKGREEVRVAVRDLINREMKREVVKTIYFTQVVVQ